MSSYSILFWCLYSLCSPGPDLLTNFCFQCRTIPWWASPWCSSRIASQSISTVSWRNARVELFPSYTGKLRQSLNGTGEIVSTCLFRVLSSFNISMFPFAQASATNPQLYKLEWLLPVKRPETKGKKQHEMFRFMIFLVSHRGNDRTQFSRAAMTLSLVTVFHGPISFTLHLLQQMKQPSGASSSRACPS